MSNQNSTNEVMGQQPEQKSLLKRNSKLMTAAIIVAVLALGAFAFNYFYLQPKEAKAQADMTPGMAYLDEAAQYNYMYANSFQMPDSLKNDSIKNAALEIKKNADAAYNKALNGDGKYPGFLKIAQESMTDAANLAKANAGICYFHLGQMEKAVEFLESYSPKGDKTLSAQYVAALGNSYASLKTPNYDKAVSSLKEAAKIADNATLSPNYLLDAALLLEKQNKNEEALQVYTQIKNDYPLCELCRTLNGVSNGSQIDKYIERVSK